MNAGYTMSYVLIGFTKVTLSDLGCKSRDVTSSVDSSRYAALWLLVELTIYCARHFATENICTDELGASFSVGSMTDTFVRVMTEIKKDFNKNIEYACVPYIYVAHPLFSTDVLQNEYGIVPALITTVMENRAP